MKKLFVILLICCISGVSANNLSYVGHKKLCIKEINGTINCLNNSEFLNITPTYDLYLILKYENYTKSSENTLIFLKNIFNSTWKHFMVLILIILMIFLGIKMILLK